MGVRLVVGVIMCVHVTIRDLNNAYALAHACAFISLDFLYEFYAKRAISDEHEREELEFRSSHGSEDVDVEVPPVPLKSA